LWEEYKFLFFKVKDNGVGLSNTVESNKKRAFGKKLINFLAAKLEAEIQLVRDNRTEVVLKINEYQKVA
jgi:two-component sensor histidine kinase